jgi:dihydrofolate synthase/folylpolyglutamate synthase
VIHGGAHEAAEAFAGHALEPAPPVSVPGRLETRAHELRDGAHNVEGVRWLLDRLDLAVDRTLCVSILRGKRAEEMVALLAAAGRRLVATASTSARALPAPELAALARPHFDRVEIEPDPVRAVQRAHALGEPVLVTGSLYLLADLARAERESPR